MNKAFYSQIFKKTSILYSIISVVLFILPNLVLANQGKEKRHYSAAPLDVKAPQIDGSLADSAWADANWQGSFVQQKPVEGGMPSKETLVKILYDENYLYAAIFCYESPENIRRVFTPRDQFGGDVAGLAFDSYLNERTAYEFNLTAAGQKIDLMHTGEGNIDLNWNSNWDGVTSVSDSGWSAEFRIPFSQLRYNNQAMHTFGFFVWRWIDTRKEEVQWVLLPVNGPHGVHNFGLLNGISGIRSSRQTEFLPYISAKYNYDGRNDNPYINNYKFLPGAGMDMKIGISSNFTVDATINPDFGQVEADPAELNLTAFETFYAEKRPFFLEGSEIFNFSVQNNSLFYSRRIGAPPSYYPDIEDNEYYTSPETSTILGSAKITGRTADRFSVGVLETVTGNEFGILYSPGPDSIENAHQTQDILAAPLTSYFASRIKKESANTNTIAGFSFNGVERQLNPEYLKSEMVRSAYTGGMDLIQYFDHKNYYLSLSGMYSHLIGSQQAITNKQKSHVHRFQRSDAPHLLLDTSRTSLTGTLGFVEFAKNSGRFLFRVNALSASPQLNLNDIGYIPQTDYIEQESGIEYRQTKPGRYLRDYSIGLEGTNRWTFGKERTWSNLLLDFASNLNNLWAIHAELEHAFTSLDPRILRGGPALRQDGYTGGGFWIQTNSSKRFFAELYNFTYFNNKNNSYHKAQGGNLNYNPVNKLKLKLEAQLERKNYAAEYFDDGLSDQNIYLVGRLYQNTLSVIARVEYYFRPEISLQYYGNPFFSVVDYQNYRRVDQSQAKDLDERFYQLDGTTQLVYDENNNEYAVSETDGTNYSFANPDVSYGSFQSNFVFRWEYKLGSTFYFVWSHNQNEYINIDSPALSHPVNGLFKTPSGDAFMIKLSYWFIV